MNADSKVLRLGQGAADEPVLWLEVDDERPGARAQGNMNLDEAAEHAESPRCAVLGPGPNAQLEEYPAGQRSGGTGDADVFGCFEMGMDPALL